MSINFINRAHQQIRLTFFGRDFNDRNGILIYFLEQAPYGIMDRCLLSCIVLKYGGEIDSTLLCPVQSYWTVSLIQSLSKASAPWEWGRYIRYLVITEITDLLVLGRLVPGGMEQCDVISMKKNEHQSVWKHVIA